MVNYIRNVEQKQKVTLYNNMITRCYSEKYQSGNPAYKGSTVCAEWLDNKQSFYEFVEEGFYRYGDEQIDLDKDILFKGNRIYSPDTCIFVPHSINTIFENLTREPVYLIKSNKYRMDIMIDGESVNIGYFDTEQEAKIAYIKHKEAAIIAKADKYKSGIPRALYKAMMGWKVTLADWDR